MTKKDYIIIARALNVFASCHCGEITAQTHLDEVVNYLCAEMRYNNPRFNAEKFREAVFKK